jgi:hypothetical protein
MTVPQPITGFLRANPRTRFCDDCIAKRLKLAIVRRHNEPGRNSALPEIFRDDMGTCFNCGGIKLVIQSE